jgi:hypothetical protein
MSRLPCAAAMWRHEFPSCVRMCVCLSVREELSNFAQPLVRIALKLLELLRAHRAAHGMGPAEDTYRRMTRRKTIGCRLTAISWRP